MTIIACLEAVALVAVVFLMLRHQSERAAAHDRQLQSLADRIQHPERPQPSAQPWEWPAQDEEPDEIDLVGTIADPKPDQGR